MTAPHQIEMDDLPLPELSQCHQNRMEELINRPAHPPPFSQDLPPRPPSPGYRRWILPGILLLLLVFSLGGNGTLTLFLAKEKSISSELQARLANGTGPTMTVPTMSSNSTATMTTNGTVTITPRPTCDPLQKLRLATNFCAMVNDCNSTIGDKPMLDCMNGNFCAMNPQCNLTGNSQGSPDLNPQMAGCCGWCGCYENHQGVIWLNNKVGNHYFGIIAETKTASGLGVRAEPTAAMSIEVPQATVTEGPLSPLSQMQSTPAILATPKTSGAARRWRKWWSRTGLRYGIREMHHEWVRWRAPR